jgi:hypothetical protein
VIDHRHVLRQHRLRAAHQRAAEHRDHSADGQTMEGPRRATRPRAGAESEERGEERVKPDDERQVHMNDEAALEEKRIVDEPR